MTATQALTRLVHDDYDWNGDGVEAKARDAAQLRDALADLRALRKLAQDLNRTAGLPLDQVWQRWRALFIEADVIITGGDD
jgi:hypothetical protein